MGLGELELDTNAKVTPAAPKKAVKMEKKDTGSDSLVIEQAAAQALTEVAKAAAEPVDDSKTVRPRRFTIEMDSSRDALLTDFGKETLNDRYLLPGESYQDLFARVADGLCRRRRTTPSGSTTISRKLWFMPATPGAVERRHRSRPADQLLSQFGVATASKASSTPGTRMSGSPSRGGGIGTYWGNVRGIGEPVGLNGKTSGIIPFVRVMDSLTLAISQGSLRRGSAACYLDVSRTRRSRSSSRSASRRGDFNRKALNLHHGVLITDEFMEAVRDGRPNAI